MTKNFFEVNNVDFNVGNKTKVKNVSFAIKKRINHIKWKNFIF